VAAYDIAAVARKSGIPASALRYYEEKGLITSIGRRGLRRLFEPTVLVRLALINVGQAAGFSLDEIAAMLGSGDRMQIDRQMLSEKAEAIDATIRKLSAMRDGLRHAAVCPAPNHIDCPSFQRIVRVITTRAKSRGTGTLKTRPLRTH
jgi:DNA-binding transcriptional MerR regulator